MKIAKVVAMMLLAAVMTPAIIIRHDREDARYLALGEKFPAVCFLPPDGEGTLIAPEWVLTAAHVAQDRRIQSVRFDDGAEYRIAAKFLHPDWRDNQPHDIALLKLAEPVRGVAPVELFAGSDEAGQVVTFVGRGDTGTGLTGPKSADKKKRAATNVVESADENWLRFTFDEPPAGTELEGVSGPGDSGGPALIERNGKTFVAGVSVFGSRGKYGPSSYGTREGYTRVSTHLSWIKSAMRGEAAALRPAAPPQQVQRSAEPPTLPDTPAGKRMAAWLPVIQKGDPAEIEKFVKEHFAARALQQLSADERANVHKEFFAETGGLKVAAVMDLGANEIEIRAQAVKTGQWYRVGLRTEPQEPHGILGFLFDEAGPPPGPGAEIRKVSEAEFPKAVADYVEKLVAEDRFSGTVLVAKNGRPIFSKAYGLSSKKENAPNRVDTKFNLGSMNKMFTAVAVAQLVEKGKLSFADTVGKHLPDFPNATVREKVTIAHLLTHTSGLGSFFAHPKFETEGGKIRSVADYMNFVKDDAPAFEPGARFQYSNSGFILLGAIIEKVTGQSYFDYVRENIFRPAGMNDSGSFARDEKVSNLATGYMRGGGERVENDRTLPGRGGPAGGGYSTVEDLLKFDVALRGNKLLSAKMRDLVLAGKIAMGPGVQYAYGFGDILFAGQRIVGHNGGAPGISAALDMYWPDGYTVAVLANYDRVADELARTIRRMILGSAP